MPPRTVSGELKQIMQITVSYGQTVNRGNFEHERIDLSITMPVEASTIKEILLFEEKLYRDVKERVERHSGKTFD